MTMRWHILLLLLLTVGLMGQRAHLNSDIEIDSAGCTESSTVFLCNALIIQAKELLAAASTTTRVRLRDADTGGEGYYKLEACSGGSGWCDFSMYGFTGFVSSELWFYDGSANQWQHKVAFHNTQSIETDADLIADGDVQVATCVQIGSLTAGSADCICRSSDGLYHDTDCDAAAIEVGEAYIGSPQIFQARRATEQVCTTSVVDVALSDESFEDSFYSHGTNGVVTLANAGVYKITANCSLDNSADSSGTERQLPRLALEKNGTPITGAAATEYIREPGSNGTGATMTIVWYETVAASDTVNMTIQCSLSGGAVVGTVPDECRLLIEYIRR